VIDFDVAPGEKVLEIGGGGNRHPKSSVNIDVRKVDDSVDFAVDLNVTPWPMQDAEWDVAYSCFCLEHLSWRRIPDVLKEVNRVLKPGGRLHLVLPNTKAQLEHILAKGEFDGDEGSMIFGDQNYAKDAQGAVQGDFRENAHFSAWSPGTATKWLNAAGFTDVLITPFGELQTDMRVDARKPAANGQAKLGPFAAGGSREAGPAAVAITGEEKGASVEEKPGGLRLIDYSKGRPKPPEVNPPAPPCPNVLGSNVARAAPAAPPAPYEPEKVFDAAYFENYLGRGFVWDYPWNAVIADKVLKRAPESVLELGCARGYVLKRLEDAGVRARGIDVSRHAYLTRVSAHVTQADAVTGPFHKEGASLAYPDGFHDLCFSCGFLEYVPEDRLAYLCGEMLRTCKRGLHGIIFLNEEEDHDPRRTTLKSREWWKERLPAGHEVVSVHELREGPPPQGYLEGEGRLKLNLGCAWTMFHGGWWNLDALDLDKFAQNYRYNFKKCDLRAGLPFGTGVVDLLFLSHVLEHFTRKEAISLLRECRRVVRPEGALRIIVPDAELLTGLYGQKMLGDFDEINRGCAEAPDDAGKLWALLFDGHANALDWESLSETLDGAGWVPERAAHRAGLPATEQLRRETVEMSYGLSLFVDAVPKRG
jgi:predicted SAM-dependent methyltransferase